MNTISKDLDINKNIRGFEYSESSRHLSNQIDKSDVDCLVETATNNYSEICHRYYKYKAKFFGNKKLELLGQECSISKAERFKNKLE